MSSDTPEAIAAMEAMRERRRRPFGRPNMRLWTKRTLVIALLAAVLAVIPVAGYFRTFVEPAQAWVVRVEDQQISAGEIVTLMRADRLQPGSAVAGLSPIELAHWLAEREVLVLLAAEVGIQVSDDDIDNAIWARSMGPDAPSRNEAPAESTRVFEERYRQYLALRDLGEELDRRVVRYGLYQSGMQAWVAFSLPETVPQLQLTRLTVLDGFVADQAVIASMGGATPEEVAATFAVTGAADPLGDGGWVPVGALEPRYEAALAGLAAGGWTEPVGASDRNVVIHRVVTEAEERALGPEALRLLTFTTLQQAVTKATPDFDVRFNFDSEAFAWVQEQMQQIRL